MYSDFYPCYLNEPILQSCQWSLCRSIWCSLVQTFANWPFCTMLPHFLHLASVAYRSWVFPLTFWPCFSLFFLDPSSSACPMNVGISQGSLVFSWPSLLKELIHSHSISFDAYGDNVIRVSSNQISQGWEALSLCLLVWIRFRVIVLLVTSLAWINYSHILRNSPNISSKSPTRHLTWMSPTHLKLISSSCLNLLLYYSTSRGKHHHPPT